jgi:hypothetical protein
LTLGAGRGASISRSATNSVPYTRTKSSYLAVRSSFARCQGSARAAYSPDSHRSRNPSYTTSIVGPPGIRTPPDSRQLRALLESRRATYGPLARSARSRARRSKAPHVYRREEVGPSFSKPRSA